MIEGDLKKLRLVTSADHLRDRILHSARRARRWQVIDRCIAAGAAATCLALVGVTSNHVSHQELLSTQAERMAVEIGAPELAGVLRQGLIPPGGDIWSVIDDLP